MNESSISLQDLLQHADWIRALARSLVRDAARADDVAQEVWVAALEAGPRHDGNLRGWLRTTARRIAGAKGVSDRARERREKLVARGEGDLPTNAELVERAELQRGVSARVLELPEPYRRTILLRYWEGLPPR